MKYSRMEAWDDMLQRLGGQLRVLIRLSPPEATEPTLKALWLADEKIEQARGLIERQLDEFGND